LSIPEGYYGGGYEWEPNPEELGFFGLYAVVDQNTGVLAGIRFWYVPQDYYTIHTAQKIFQELGPPAYIFIGTGQHFVNVEKDDVILVSLFLYYGEGMSFTLTGHSSPIQRDDGSFYYEFCLNEEPIAGAATITAPYTTLSEADLDPLQQRWMRDERQGWSLTTMDVFGISEQEFVDLASIEHPCAVILPDDAQ
jgi:hypothetical protein